MVSGGVDAPVFRHGRSALLGESGAPSSRACVFHFYILPELFQGVVVNVSTAVCDYLTFRVI